MRAWTTRLALTAALVLPSAFGAGAEEASAPPAADESASEAGPTAPIETIVVTATRTETRLDDVTTSISVVDEDEIAEQQALRVLDVLRDVPGVDLVQTGSRGSNTQIFIRGADADQTLVLVDGQELNSVTLGTFDFSGFTTDNVERVEVLRGTGGTLYGSQAVGGVVNIITKRGRGRPSVSVTGEGGNGATGRGSIASSGQIGALGYSLAGSYFDTQGFQPENDDYRNGTASVRLDYDVYEQATARLLFRYVNSEIGLVNNNNYLAAPDPNARQNDEIAVVKGEWEQALLPELDLRLSTGYTYADQHFDDPPDAAETTLTRSDIPTGLLTGELQANHYWRETAITTVGLEVDNRTADVASVLIDPAFEIRDEFDESRYNVAGYVQEQLRFLDGALIGVGGVRVDGNEEYGTEVSPAGSLGYRLPVVPVRLKAGYAEGFRAPTFNELFYPDFGNPDLEAETSREWNVGVVVSAPEDRATLEITFFDRDTDNLIEGEVQDDGTFLAVNRGDVHVRGLEVAPAAVVWREPRITVGASYTHLETVSDEPLLRRPKDRGGVNLNVAGRDLFRPRTRYDLNVNLLAVGDRLDVDPSAGFTTQDNPAYAKLDIAAAYTLEGVLARSGDLTFFVKVENVLDEDYEEALGFDAPPVNFLAGIRAAF